MRSHAERIRRAGWSTRSSPTTHASSGVSRSSTIPGITALPAGASEEARHLAKRRPVQELGSAGSAARADPGWRQAEEPRRWVPPFRQRCWVLDHGLAAVEAACAEALEAGMPAVTCS